MRTGVPLPVRPRPSILTSIVEPTLGLNVSQPSVDAPLGSTPSSDNWIMREGGLEPRPMLSRRGATSAPLGNNVITGLYELTSVTNARFPLASGTTRVAVYGQASAPNDWSVLSYVSAGGVNDPPNLAAGTDYYDFAQVYFALRDENIAYMAAGSYQSLYVTQSNTTVFSSMTGAPRARFVASLDNYVMAFNIREGSADYVQRAQWCDRGSASSWTGGLSGFEDLLSMKGQGTRIWVQDNKFLLSSDEEIWQAVQRDYPFTWQFGPYDTTRGCPYSWTVTNTPMGTMFLGKDYQVYLLPKGGGTSQPIGQPLHRSIRNLIDQPGRAWAVYDNTYGQFQLYYPIKGGSGYPQRAVFLDINEGSWAPQSFDRTGGALSVTRGAEVALSSSATTWGGLHAAGIRWADLNMSWADLGGVSEQRAVMMGTSNGTLAYMNSVATSDFGTAVECYWQSPGMFGNSPEQQKTVNQFRVDYQADSASSLTVRFSQTLGQSFGVETQVNLPAVSGISQAIVDTYFAARYPAFEVRTQNARPRLFRFHINARAGGR